MYLRTPKRYTRGQKRSPISLRWLWLWLLTPVVVVVGLLVYQNADTLGPPIHQAIYGVFDSAGNTLATAAAPTALPTVDPSARLARADADWREGRIDSAVRDYQAVLDAVPNDVQIYYRVTLGLLSQGQLEAALDAAERTITADPFSADAWTIRSMALDWNSRYGEAIASALRALELNPQSARALAALAEAYKDLNQGDLALETVERALELDPDSFEAYRVRGWIRWEVQFDSVGARDDFQTAYDLAPNLPYLAVDLARITFASQNVDEAISILRDVVEQNPQNTIALFELGNYYFQGQGNFTQAAEYLSRCVAANPDSINCNFLLGRVQFALEQYTQAAESLQKAVDLGTTSSRHYYWAGRAQIVLGDCPAAVPLLERSVELAQQVGNTEVLTAAQDSLRECQVFAPSLEQPAPELTPTAEA